MDRVRVTVVGSDEETRPWVEAIDRMTNALLAGRAEAHQFAGGTATDAVVVIVDADDQYATIARALHAGRHVLATSPFGASSGESRRLCDHARDENVLLLDASSWLHHPRTEQIRSILASERIGRIRRVSVSVSEPAGPLPVMTYRAVAAALWAFGAAPVTLSATSGDVDEDATVLLDFGEGSRAIVDVAVGLPARQWIEIVGTAGSVVCDDLFVPREGRPPRFWLHDASGSVHEHGDGPADPVMLMMEQFLNHIADATRWGVGRRSVAAQAISELALEAARTGDRIVVRGQRAAG